MSKSWYAALPATSRSLDRRTRALQKRYPDLTPAESGDLARSFKRLDAMTLAMMILDEQISSRVVPFLPE